MARIIAAIIAGYAVWTIIWLGAGAIVQMVIPDFMPEEGPVTNMLGLVILLAMSVTCSIVGGLTCRIVSKKATLGPAFVLGALLLATGVGVQAGYWDVMPLWYHIVFLLMLFPVTVGGYMIVPNESPAAATAGAPN